MQNREQLYARIQWSLVTFSEYLKLNSSQNFNTSSVILEDTCVHLLNLVFGHQLTNLNAEVANAPAADLIYRAGRIAYQITINDTPAKVSDTHAKAIDYGLGKYVDKLTIFFFVREAPAEDLKQLQVLAGHLKEGQFVTKFRKTFAKDEMDDDLLIVPAKFQKSEDWSEYEEILPTSPP